MAPEGRVIKTGAASVIVTGSGWKRGDNVEFLQMRPAATEEEPPEEPERIATGRVLSTTERQARVSLGIDTRVPLGLLARRCEEAHSDYPLAPARMPKLVDVGFDVRAFLPIGVPGGVGVLATALGMYRFDAPVALRLHIDSAGFVTSSPGGGTFDGIALATLDTQYFEVGVGAGTLTQTDTRPASMSFEFAQFLRIGSIDGLMAQAQIATDQGTSGARLATFLGLVQVPITRSWWILGRGAWAQQRWAYGDIATRHLLSGSGDHGSLFVTAAVGGAGVGVMQSYPTACCTTNAAGFTTCYSDRVCPSYYQASSGGSSVAVGLEWRL
jgi:hypothetical protein